MKQENGLSISGFTRDISGNSRARPVPLECPPPRVPTTRPIVGGIDLNRATTGPGGPFGTYSTPLNSRSAPVLIFLFADGSYLGRSSHRSVRISLDFVV